jgi:4-hydroxybenzoate polyprenyltransferase
MRVSLAAKREGVVRKVAATSPGRTRSVVGLARACHPGPVVAVSTAAVGYALAIGCTRREAIRVGLAVSSGQLAIGWQNDWTDAVRDQLGGRRDKPIPNGEVTRSLVGTAAVLAGVCCVPASLANGRTAGLTHLAAVLSAASYNAGLKSTPASFVPYAFSFSLLPVFVQLSREDASFPPAWAPAAAGALGVAAHLLNALPDRDLDRSLGILGLPQRLSRERSLALAGVLLVASSGLVSFAPRRREVLGPLGFLASFALAGAAVHAGRARDDRRAFRLVLVLALLDVARLLLEGGRVRDSASGVPGSDEGVVCLAGGQSAGPLETFGHR